MKIEEMRYLFHVVVDPLGTRQFSFIYEDYISVFGQETNISYEPRTFM